MKIQARGKNGELLFDESGKPIMIDVEGEELKAERERAAAEARRHADIELDKTRKEQARLEQELAARDAKEKEMRLASLPPDQQTSERLREFERQLAAERASRMQDQQTYQAGIRNMQLVAYRERAVRDVPPEVADFVSGSTEAEIDQSVDRAKRTFAELEAKMRSQITADVTGRLVPLGMAPPANPAYVPPPVVAQGFPTATNPPSAPLSDSAPQADLRAVLSEDGVRTGRYSGELRDRIHAQYRGVQYQGNLGTAPRHWTQPAPQPAMQYAPQPGGVMVPQGIPTPPSYTPQQVQYQQQFQPQYAPQPMPVQYAPQYAPQPMPPGLPMMPQFQPAPAPMPVQGDPMANAVARTHAGVNPVVAGDPAAANALAQAKAHAAQRGIADPIQAFAQRFQNTPPAQG